MVDLTATSLLRNTAGLRMDRLQRVLLLVSARSDLAIVIMMVVAIAVMILPLPTPLIDLLIALNIGASVMVLMVAMYLDRPTKFSTLPAVILISTLFRLATEVAVTRVVLVEADAGEIVRAFGDFVVSGNVVVGLVTFLIITVVQFIVITKGSERVAEVAARFTLDALPGKQMSIDSDLRGGDITKDEARRQRRLLGQESQLFGAMDGAMKFVKGDAITGLVVVVINLLGGIAVGCVQHGMAIGQAVQTYSLLTVGDGLVAQIPALLISFAAGTVVTRVATDEPRDLGTEILGQMANEPRALLVAAAVLALLAVVPGFPTLVFLMLAGAAAGSAALLMRRRAANIEAAREGTGQAPVHAGRSEADAGKPAEQPSDDRPIMFLFSAGFLRPLDGSRLGSALSRRRDGIASRFGFEQPMVTVQPEETLVGGEFRIDIDGVPALSGEVPGEGMVLVGKSARLAEFGIAPETYRPAPGWPDSVWVESRHQAALVEAGLEPADLYEALGICLERTIEGALGRFMGIQEARQLLTRAENDYRDLVQEAQRVVPMQTIAEVFRRLVDERVALRPIRLILGALVEAGPREQDPPLLTEHVRSALRRQISHSHAKDGLLPVLVVEREAEDQIRASVRQTPVGPRLALPEDALAALLDGIRQSLQHGARPALLTAFDVRHLLRGLLVRHEIDLPVLSYQDLSSEISVQPMGSINCPARGPAGQPLHLVRGADGSDAAE